ncbi:MAG TPA: hypothetical protein VHI52_18900 [Verrucomicrobiae bacterium]|nr:hypothetical protein [Verrucomicrobiae bacterium]HWB11760.1 hypothetical protein [Pirellulales bacterium]
MYAKPMAHRKVAQVTSAEYQSHIWNLVRTCSINQRYHQRLEWWWKIADRTAKILVAVVAVAALVVTLLDEEWKPTELWLAGIAAVLAIVLNVLPFGEYEKEHGEFFRAWSDIRIDTETLCLKTCEEPVSGHMLERLSECAPKSTP